MEFRIPEPQTRSASSMREPPEPQPPQPVEPSDLNDQTVADVATNMWRMLRRFSENGHSEVPKEQRMAVRNLNAMSDRLADAGIRVQDHDGMSWDPGLSLEAIAYEPRPNLDGELVVETVRPSIYRGNRCIQRGQVIVGMPEKRTEQ
jgi:hypothetical protein